MKTQMKFVAATLTLMAAAGVQAQSAGTWMARIGATNITPSVDSGCISAPDFGIGGCSRADVGSDTQLSGGITYMYTDHWSVDLPLALPFKHKVYGAGSVAGAGQLAEVTALPMSVFLQYRFMDANAKFRPYIGLGATYAYFYDETGSGKLTALLNPGGPPTTVSVDAKWIVTPQIGATIGLNDKWFVDIHYSKSSLSTTNHYSTGQTQDIALDPATVGIEVGYKF